MWMRPRLREEAISTLVLVLVGWVFVTGTKKSEVECVQWMRLWLWLWRARRYQLLKVGMCYVQRKAR